MITVHAPPMVEGMPEEKDVVVQEFYAPPELNPFNCSVDEFLERNRDIKAITGGVLFNQGGHQLQLVRFGKSHAGEREGAGGGVERSDRTVLHGCVREFKQETGLTIVSLSSDYYLTPEIFPVTDRENPKGDKLPARKLYLWANEIAEFPVNASAKEVAEHVELNPYEHTHCYVVNEEESKEISEPWFKARERPTVEDVFMSGYRSPPFQGLPEGHVAA